MSIMIKSKEAPAIVHSFEFPDGYSLKYRFPTHKERMYVDAIASSSPLLLGEKAPEAAKRIGELGAAATEYRLKAVVQGWDGFVEEIDGKEVSIPFSWNAFSIACQQVPSLFGSAMDCVHAAWAGKRLDELLKAGGENNDANPTTPAPNESSEAPSAGSAAENSPTSSATSSSTGAS